MAGRYYSGKDINQALKGGNAKTRNYRKRWYQYLPALPSFSRGSGSGSFFGNSRFSFGLLSDFFELIVGRFSYLPQLLMGAGAIVLILFIIMLVSDFRQVKALGEYHPDVTTRIYDRNGELVAELFRQKREVVPMEQIPPQLINAFIAMEDNDFYDHWGVSPKGIVRAMFVNILHGGVRQGGSTITQQLAKVLLTSGERSIFRKIKEAFIALMIEAMYSKDRIMELYLNQIFLGHEAYGVETASKLYFNKHVKDLSLAECALLATLPSAPNMLSPIKYPKTSMRLHRIALARMAVMGFCTIEEAEKAYLDFWPDYLTYINNLSPTVSTWSRRVDKAPWFTEYIRRKLINEFGADMVYNKGLKVYTTLDLTKQLAAQKVMEEGLARQTQVSGQLLFRNEDYIIENYLPTADFLTSLFGIELFKRSGTLENKKINDYFKTSALDELEILNFFTGPAPVTDFCREYKGLYAQDKDFLSVEGALISIDQTNGYIEALVGGSRFTSYNQLNRAIQSYRQAGSSIKPLLYAAAMESKKFTPASTILDSPTIFLDFEGGSWIPENYEGEYYGMVRLRDALTRSINVVSIQIAEKLKIDTVLAYYRKLLRMDESTAKRRIPRNLSVALGSLEVSPLEMARAYAIIANGGGDVIPFSIRYVQNMNGETIMNTEKEIQDRIAAEKKNNNYQIIKPDTAQVMISLMSSVVSGGTGTAAHANRPTAGKTGTTNNYRDAWFVGFTPEVTTCVWVGYDSQGMSLGLHQSGGAVAAPLWGNYMRSALARVPEKPFPSYAGLESVKVCAESGLLPGNSCTRVIDEVFIPGTEPESRCSRCGGSDVKVDWDRDAPGSNIANEQERRGLNQLKNGSSGNVIDNFGGDLLD